jgi:hypothetical protein
MYSHTPNNAKLAGAGVIFLALLALALAPASSRADFQFSLDTGNSSGLGTGPYATVDIHEISATDVTITFTAVNGYAFVDGGSMGFNVANTGDAFGIPTSNGESLSLANPLPTNEDGFGKFNEVWDQKDSSTPATILSVEITGSGFSVTSSSQNVLTANSNGALAASHILVVGSQNGFTGYASGSGGVTPPVEDAPAPQSAVLFGVGALGLVGFMAFPRRRKAAATA